MSLFEWIAKKLGLDNVISLVGKVLDRLDSLLCNQVLILANQEEIGIKLNLLLVQEELIEPEPPEVEIFDAKQPRDTWPEFLAGMRVGYVLVGEEKSPLLVEDDKHVLQIYENDALRPELNTTDGKRIIAKAGKWLAVVYTGDEYSFGIPRPFGQELDGDDVYYKVMHEQTIDGVQLWNVPELPELFIKFDHVDHDQNYIKR